MKIVIISPTYNEKINITKMIPVLLEEVFPKIKNHDMYLLIVDDTSPDGTGDVVREFMKKWENIELLEGAKNGLGSAYIRGMQYAIEKMHADAVIEFDADFQHDPHDIPRLIAAMDEDVDYVIGSRYVKGGEIPKEWGFDRKIKSIFGSLFARIVLFTFGIHDMTSGFKLTKTSYLERVDLVNLYSRNYAYKMQILYEVVKLGAKVKEVPIIFYERTQGKSKMDTNDLIESFMVVLKLRVRDSMRFIKFLIVGGTGFIVQLLLQEGTIAIGFARLLAVLVSGIIATFFAYPDVTALSHAIGAGFGAEAAIISNFLFNNFWTFNDRRGKKHLGKFIFRFFKFNGASLLSIFIQAFMVWIGEKVVGPMSMVGAIQIPTRILVVVPTIILLVIPLNYIIYNNVIWKHKHETTTPTL